jgi:signal peptidase II
MVWTIILIILVLIDQVSKYATRTFIEVDGSITIINNFFYLTHRINKGAAWSFLAGQSWGIYVLASVSFIASVIMIYLIYKTPVTKLKIAITLICGGSIGNLIDRVVFRGVTDFLDFHFGSYVFPTFNVADSLVVCGSIFLAFVVITDAQAMNEISNLLGADDVKIKTAENTKLNTELNTDTISDTNTEANTNLNTATNTKLNTAENTKLNAAANTETNSETKIDTDTKTETKKEDEN